MKRSTFVVAIGLTAMAAAAPAALDKAGMLSAAAGLQPGQWQVRDLEGETPTRSFCLADPAELLRVEHRMTECTQTVVEEGPKTATVHYRCGDGIGRTTIRVGTPRLVKIDTQGIQDRLPFAYRLEARRVGECATGGTGR